MKKFELISKDLQDFKDGKIEDLIYEIKGNEILLKKIIYDKISSIYDPLQLNSDLIKQLKLYVTDGSNNNIDIFLDIDEYMDLHPIYNNNDVKIDDVNKIKEIFIDWLLG